MAGLKREDVVHLSAEDLAAKLEEIGLPKTLTRALEAKNIKGLTLLLFEQEDIKHELEELSTEDRMYLRNFLRDIERSTDFNPKYPYLLIHSEKDDKAFTVMVGDQTYNSISRGEDSVGHAKIQLLALFFVFHLEYPQPLQNLYLYLQQFILGDHDLCSSVRVVNSYHEAIQPYLVFANSFRLSGSK